MSLDNVFFLSLHGTHSLHLLIPSSFLPHNPSSSFADFLPSRHCLSSTLLFLLIVRSSSLPTLTLTHTSVHLRTEVEPSWSRPTTDTSHTLTHNTPLPAANSVSLLFYYPTCLHPWNHPPHPMAVAGAIINNMTNNTLPGTGTASNFSNNNHHQCNPGASVLSPAQV